MKYKDEFGASGGMPPYDEMASFKYVNAEKQKKTPKNFIIGISIATFILFAVWLMIKIT